MVWAVVKGLMGTIGDKTLLLIVPKNVIYFILVAVWAVVSNVKMIYTYYLVIFHPFSNVHVIITNPCDDTKIVVVILLPILHNEGGAITTTATTGFSTFYNKRSIAAVRLSEQPTIIPISGTKNRCCYYHDAKESILGGAKTDASSSFSASSPTTEFRSTSGRP
jgi:hypothetical protein